MPKREVWKKQLMRMKQMGRSDRSELLSEPLLLLEQRIDNIKQVYHGISKKLQTTLHSVDPEKRSRKINESLLSKSLFDPYSALFNDDSLGHMLRICGEIQSSLAASLVTYETQVDIRVLGPILDIVEKDIPSIVKLRKQLTKLAQALETDRAKLTAAQRQTIGGASIQQVSTKIDGLKEELEDSEHKLIMCRDQLETEMFIFISNENKLHRLLLQLVESQVEYHRNSVTNLKNRIPEMKQHMDQCPRRPVYGCLLPEHLSHSGREIASVIEGCVDVLKKVGMNEEGLFRVASGASKVKKLKAAFDANMVDWEDYVNDPHCITGALKLYLRELPEPLLTFQLYNDWMQAGQHPADQRAQHISVVLKKMPKAYSDNLQYLIRFLSQLTNNSDVNKMTAINIAIVIAPNLLWQQGTDGPSMLSTGVQNALVETLVTHCHRLFPSSSNVSQDDSMNTSCTMRSQSSSPPLIHNVNNDLLLTSAATSQLMTCSLPPFSPPRTPLKRPLARSRSQVQKDLWCRHVDTGSLRAWPDRPRTANGGSVVNHASLSARSSCLSVAACDVGQTVFDTLNRRSVEKSSSCNATNGDARQSTIYNMLNHCGPAGAVQTGMNSLKSNRSTIDRSFGCPSSSANLGESELLSLHSSGLVGSQSSETSLPSVTMSSLDTTTSLTVLDPKCGWRPPCNGGRTPEFCHRARSFAVTPPKSVHSDMYNTVFALHSLKNNGGCEEYLSRVRTLWDSHMDVNKRHSYDYAKVWTTDHVTDVDGKLEDNPDNPGDQDNPENSGDQVTVVDDSRLSSRNDCDLNDGDVKCRRSSNEFAALSLSQTAFQDIDNAFDHQSPSTVGFNMPANELQSSTTIKPPAFNESDSTVVSQASSSDLNPVKLSPVATIIAVTAQPVSPYTTKRATKRPPPPAPPSERTNSSSNLQESSTTLNNASNSLESTNRPPPKAAARKAPVPQSEQSDNGVVLVVGMTVRSAELVIADNQNAARKEHSARNVENAVKSDATRKDETSNHSEATSIKESGVDESQKPNRMEPSQFTAAQSMVNGILKRTKPPPMLTRPTTMYVDGSNNSSSVSLSPQRRSQDRMDTVNYAENWKEEMDGNGNESKSIEGMSRPLSAGADPAKYKTFSNTPVVGVRRPENDFDSELQRADVKKPTRPAKPTERPAKPTRPVTTNCIPGKFDATNESGISKRVYGNAEEPHVEHHVHIETETVLADDHSNSTALHSANKDSIMGPTLKDFVVGPTLKDSIVGPTLKDSIVGPTFKDSIVGPTLKDSIVGPTLKESIVGPTLGHLSEFTSSSIENKHSEIASSASSSSLDAAVLVIEGGKQSKPLPLVVARPRLIKSDSSDPIKGTSTSGTKKIEDEPEEDTRF